MQRRRRESRSYVCRRSFLTRGWRLNSVLLGVLDSCSDVRMNFIQLSNVCESNTNRLRHLSFGVDIARQQR